MTRKTLAIALLWVLAVASFAAAISGSPTTDAQSLSVSTIKVTFPATFCREGGTTTGLENPALLQIATPGGIYYFLNSRTATPYATAYFGGGGDVIEVRRPSQFIAVRSGSADTTVFGTCFSQ